ncbi:uncharacterized protein LOC113469500 [Diaphorina citri]|uniref:Uncharacterized protein LOC113469500 n=1 Tax=Diaphorina citri TaxID=121845 RepID=A0A3Q0J3K5_DIACI|nr:uncharacterized protein LOC113469500 [Diaphorina citri]
MSLSVNERTLMETDWFSGRKMPPSRGWFWNFWSDSQRQRNNSLPLDKVDRSFWDVIKNRPNSLSQLNKVIDASSEMKVKQAKAENFFHPDAKTLDMVPAPIIERQDS